MSLISLHGMQPGMYAMFVISMLSVVYPIKVAAF